MNYLSYLSCNATSCSKLWNIFRDTIKVHICHFLVYLSNSFCSCFASRVSSKINFDQAMKTNTQSCNYKTHTSAESKCSLGLFHDKSNSLRRILFVNYHYCEAFWRYCRSKNAIDHHLMLFQNYECPYSFTLQKEGLKDSIGCVFSTAVLSFMLACYCMFAIFDSIT